MATLRLKPKNSTPTNRVTGTSYQGKPAVVPPRGIYTEVGSQRGSSIPEIVPELASRQIALRTYGKMVKGDASVRVSLRAGKSPAYAGDYYIDPFNDTDQSRVIAGFVGRNIFHCPSSPWLITIQDIFRMLENGNSVLNPVYELREWAPPRVSTGTAGGNAGVANRKVYTMLSKMAFRPANTIIKFNYDDNGGPESVDHNAIRADGRVEIVNIPIDQLMIFVFEGDGTDLDGTSILRSAYEHWFYKHNLYKIDAIQKERHGIGVPDIELPIGFSDTDRKIAHQLGRNLRTNEYAYIVRPPNFTVGFAELKGQLVNVLESADHHDLQIMKNVLLQFLQPNADGGRATSATAYDVFMKSIRYLGSYVCECYNKFLIPKLVAYNFDTDEFPSMKVRNIGEVKDTQMWASAVSRLVHEGIITLDDDTEQYVREVTQFPKLIGPRPNETAQAAANGNKPKTAQNSTDSANQSNSQGNVNEGTPSGA